MAFQLKLVRMADFTADQDDLSLAAYTDGFNLAEGGWTPAMPEGSDAISVFESLLLRARGTSMDNLAAVLRGLEQYAVWARQYQGSMVEKYGVWLRAQLEGETNARQAMVFSLRHQAGEGYRQAWRGAYTIPKYYLTLERAAWWENTGAVTYTQTGINSVGGMSSYGGITGDAPGRLAKVAIEPTNATSVYLNQVWVGFRTERFGTAANFQSYWSLRKASYYNGDTTGGTSHADATAKDGYKAVCTFGVSATLVNRVKCKVSDVTANYSDQRGRFTVLLRAKLSAAGTVRVRLRDGLYSSSGQRVQSRAVITSTSWKFYELGTTQLPPAGRLFEGSDSLDNVSIGVDAELVSGSCNLEMDCLVLIPIEEGWMQVSDGYADPDKPIYVTQHPNGEVLALNMSASTTAYSQAIGRVYGGLPVGTTGQLVAAAQRAGSSDLADTLEIVIKAYKRWAGLKGAA